MINTNEVLKKARSQGYISYLDFMKCMPEDIVDEEQIEDIIQLFIDMGIEIRKEKADVIWIHSKTK